MNDSEKQNPEFLSGQMVISLAELRGVPIFQTESGSVVILTGITADFGRFPLLSAPEPAGLPVPDFADQPSQENAPMPTTMGFEAIGQAGDSKGWYPLSRLYNWDDGKRTIFRKTYGEYCAEQLKS